MCPSSQIQALSTTHTR
ncbi:hypothetical protein CR513_12122 [Mucuna pruriens]|uniref:Uncharacterized protein n=1 Tax=Mucuna pruriens TaxID=157652 RepID=A0A371HNB5_MUCPR|nr:hypothetical protein CR513_12122 [Mucuna pruriens]